MSLAHDIHGQVLAAYLAEAFDGGSQAQLRLLRRGAPDLQRHLAPKHGVDVEGRQVGMVVRVQVRQEHLRKAQLLRQCIANMQKRIT